jgi:hypothetical protein
MPAKPSLPSPRSTTLAVDGQTACRSRESAARVDRIATIKPFKVKEKQQHVEIGISTRIHTAKRSPGHSAKRT